MVMLKLDDKYIVINYVIGGGIVFNIIPKITLKIGKK